MFAATYNINTTHPVKMVLSLFCQLHRVLCWQLCSWWGTYNDLCTYNDYTSCVDWWGRWQYNEWACNNTLLKCQSYVLHIFISILYIIIYHQFQNHFLSDSVTWWWLAHIHIYCLHVSLCQIAIAMLSISYLFCFHSNGKKSTFA